MSFPNIKRDKDNNNMESIDCCSIHKLFEKMVILVAPPANSWSTEELTYYA